MGGLLRKIAPRGEEGWAAGRDRLNEITRDLFLFYFPELAVLVFVFFAVIFAACVGGAQ